MLCCRDQSTETPLPGRPGPLPLDYAVAYNLVGAGGQVAIAGRQLLRELRGPEPCLLHLMLVSVDSTNVDWGSSESMHALALLAECCVCGLPPMLPLPGTQCLHPPAKMDPAPVE